MPKREVLNLLDALEPLAQASAAYVTTGAKPTMQQLLMFAEVLAGCVKAIQQLRANLANFPNRPSYAAPPPHSGRLEADLGMIAATMREAATHDEPVTGEAVLGFAIALDNLHWRARDMETLLGILPPPPPPPPINPASLRALAQLSGGSIAA